MSVDMVRRAWGLWRSEESTETLLALALLGVTFGPYIIRFYRDNSASSGGGSSNSDPEVL